MDLRKTIPSSASYSENTVCVSRVLISSSVLYHGMG